MRKKDYEEVSYMALDTIMEELERFPRGDTERAMFTIKVEMETGEKIEIGNKL